jgi:DNA primase
VKFLFLPAEHDPDSYIREHGEAAFSRCVKEALPLSQVPAGGGGADCDRDSAEGRARMAAQARPLWSALPDGALRRQLLDDLAHAVGIGSADLAELWKQAAPGGRGRRGPTGAPAPAAANGGGSSASAAGDPPPHDPDGRATSWSPDWTVNAERARAGGGRRRWTPPPPPRMLGTPRAGVGRADRAVGLLLSNGGAWEQLSADDHAMLAHLPPPHGPVMTWLEARLHEHGPQPWAVVREALRGHEHEAFAMQQGDLAAQNPDPETEAAEIGEVMTRLRIEHLKAQESEAIARAATEPAQLQRYRDLQELRKALQHKIGDPAV